MNQTEPKPFHGLLDLAPGEFQEMSKLEMQSLVHAVNMDATFTLDQLNGLLKGQLVGQIMLKRMAYHLQRPADVAATPAVLALVMCLDNNERPGSAVMWAYTLILLASRLGHRVTVDDLCHAFPDGFPTMDALRGRWEEQKRQGQPDNLLDLPETWEPLTAAIK